MGVLLAGGLPGLLNQSSAQVIDGSLTLQRANANYLTRAIGTEGNRRTWTYSCWIKRDDFPAAARQLWGQVATAGASATGAWQLYYAANEALEIHTYSLTHLKTNAVYRDTGWYHVVQTLDTTSGTADNRVRLYINGVEQTSFATRNNPNQNLELGVNTVGNMVIGTADNAKSTYYIDAKMAQVNFIDGQALGPESFGFTDPLTNTWRPKKYTGDYTISASGTVYSNFAYGDFTRAAANAFDGDTSSRAEPHDNDTVYFDFTHVNSTGTLKNYNSNSRLPTYLNQGGLAAGDGLRNNPIYHAFDGSNSTYCDMTYLNGQYARLTFEHPITNVTNITIGYDGEGDPGYNGGNHQTSVSFNGSRQSIQLYNGSAITLNNLDFISQSGNGVCRLYDVTITTSSASATELTFDGGVDVSSGLRTYMAKAGSPSANHYTVNGANWGSSVGSGWLTITGVSKLRNIAMYHASGSSSVELFAVEVDSSILTDGTAAQGVNSFYLPMDGNSPIGQDKSGNGNDWTPVNFGGFNSVDKATGALPILEGPGGVVANVATRTDANASNLVLALPLIGNTNDVSNQINSGSTTKVITANGDPTASTTQSNFYGGSFDFDESGDYLSVPSTSDMTFGTGDFTIEGWFYYDATSTPNNGLYQIAGSHLVNNSNTLSCNFETSGGRTQQLYFGSAGGWRQNGTDYEFPFQKWNHVAQVRSSGVIKTYINGKLSQSWADTTDYTFTHCVVGGYYSSSYLWDGYIQDFRVYKGAAKYTGDFVPASTNPDILPDTPSGVSGGSKLAKVTDGAVSFDGSGDYLTAGQSEDYNFGTGSFTIECFAYFNNITSSQDITDFTNNASATGSPGGQFYFSSSGGGTLQWYESSTAYAAAAGKIIPKKWHHLAVVKNSSGNTIKIYIDGKEEGSSSHTETSGTNAGSLRIGLQGATYFNGFLSNLRVIKGTALYTSNFTPPTRTLTNVTNTKLLCCQSNTSATEGAVKPGTITANGDAAVTNFNPFNVDINTVRGQETGYATLNPLATSTKLTLSEGNLRVKQTGSDYALSPSTLTVNSGKWYIEVDLVNERFGFGIAELNKSNLDTWIGQTAYDWGWKWDGTSSAVRHDTNGGGTAYASATSAGDVIALAFDLSGTPGTNTGVMTYYKNGISQGAAFSDIPIAADKFYQILLGDDTSSQAVDAIINFGQKPFKFPPPAGFQPLNAANVRPETVISRPGQYVGVTTYTGNGTGQSINTGQKPDFVWIKPRTAGNYHNLYDSVRGADKALFSNTTDGQVTYDGRLTSFDLSGFTVGNVSTGGVGTNEDARPFVVWSWKAGGNKNTFNVDDVGYASASDVNMSVGALNSAVYNQSQTWSNNLAANTGSVSNPTYAFNGNLTNGADTSASTGSDDRILTATLGLTLSNEYVEVYPNHTYSGYYTTINGVKQTTQYFTSTGGWKIMGPFTGTLTSVSVTNGTESSNRPAGIRGIKVGGKLLVDNGVSVANAPLKANTGASVGTKQGFSIVKFTNDTTSPITLSHGLTQAPTFVILKALTGSVGWTVGHTSIGFTKRLKLNTSDGESASANFFNDTAPTSSLITLGANNVSNDFIMYSWHDVPGLQKFGSYTGVNSTDGPFLELGFRPSIIMFKNISSGSTEWVILDNKRNGFNGTAGNNILFPSTSGVENATQYGDFLSNGWKFRINSSYVNSTDTFIYAAWAEAPVSNLYGGQSNAR
jgi:hypothetical protein